MSAKSIVMAGAAGAVAANYIEDVFSTFLYTGTGATEVVNNGIDLAGKGGLVWLKARTSGPSLTYHSLQTSTGGNSSLSTNNSNSAGSGPIGAFTSNGFEVFGGSAFDYTFSGTTYASWTFRKAPKFFDVVTYTGNGTTNNVSHSLGSTPGFILIKKTSGTGDWIAICRKNDTQGIGLYLNSTAANYYDGNWPFGIPVADATTLKVSWINDQIVAGCNDSGSTYVAYLFAHNAGGFGASGTDNVISCGSYTGNGVSSNFGQGVPVTLGWEPQWVLIKRATGGSGGWWLGDNMRGLFGNGANGKAVQANTSGAEQTYGVVTPNATGFTIDQSDSGVNANGDTYIYIAIRRGPMRTPTSGTSVFAPATTVNGAFPYFTSGFPVDLGFRAQDRSGTPLMAAGSRLIGSDVLYTDSTGPEGFGAAKFDSNTGWFNSGSNTPPSISWMFARAPGFFDVVCYTGNGTSIQEVNHNLATKPELLIVKKRSGVGDWYVFHTIFGISNVPKILLNSADAASTPAFTADNLIYPSSFVVLGSNLPLTTSGSTYVAYLFATVAGVSKVGSYTGNGSSQTINCGFTAGARFVLIKRTDSTGDWYVWDTARGIVSANDPHLSLNSPAAEVTTNDSIDPDNTGFIVNQVAATNINVSSATYIFLAIA